MTLLGVGAIMQALTRADVRFIVAGGLAVSIHGYVRFTRDVDLVIDLAPDNIRRAFAALKSLGYAPIVPVTAEEFTDDATRAMWAREKGMTVVQFWSDAHPTTPIDIFVEAPFNFDIEHEQATIRSLGGDVDVRFVCRATLIRMKEQVGRPQDLIDVEHLRMREADDDRT